MQQLSKYDSETQELIVRFGLKFLDCIEENKQPQQVSCNQQQNEVKLQTDQLTYLINNLHIQQLENSKTLNAKLDKVLCTSAGLGQQGEYLVEKALMQQYPLAIVTNMSKVTNSGDLLVIIEGKRILVEVKKYSKTIDTKEVLKFMNDVNTSQCDCGIFIAFEQRIANKPRISFELSDSGKQVVFLAQQEGTDSLLVIIELMCQFLQQQHLNVDKLQKQQDIARQSIQQSIATIKKQHTQTANQLKQLKQTWDQLIQLEESMNNIVSSWN